MDRAANMPKDLVRACYPAFADLRDRLGLRTVRHDGSIHQFSAKLEGPRFSLHFIEDRVEWGVSVALPSAKKSHSIERVLEKLGLWNHPHSRQHVSELAHVFEANLARVLGALQDPAFLAAIRPPQPPPIPPFLMLLRIIGVTFLATRFALYVSAAVLILVLLRLVFHS
jgi:hypothetical protein